MINTLNKKEKYLIIYLCYDGPGERKYLDSPVKKYYDSLDEARDIVKLLAQNEYKLLAEDADFDWLYDVDFDGPYEAVVRRYYDPPSEGDRDYINITEYYITPVTERKDDECIVAYIDRSVGQHLHFIHAQYAYENLPSDSDCAIHYDITDEFGDQLDSKQMNFNTKEKKYENIIDAIPDLIEFHYQKRPETNEDRDFEILEYVNDLH